ncbi:hypothetical protein DNTS_003477, partial [Danionella cerebrum]
MYIRELRWCFSPQRDLSQLTGARTLLLIPIKHGFYPDLKEKKQVEETENGKEVPANGNVENEENGDPENDVDEEDDDVAEEEDEDDDGEDDDDDEEAEGGTGKRSAEDDDEDSRERSISDAVCGTAVISILSCHLVVYRR